MIKRSLLLLFFLYEDNFLAKKIVDGESLTKFFRLHINPNKKMRKIGIIVILLVLLSKLYISLIDFVNLITC